VYHDHAGNPGLRQTAADGGCPVRSWRREEQACPANSGRGSASRARFGLARGRAPGGARLQRAGGAGQGGSRADGQNANRGKSEGADDTFAQEDATH
jgi:hypothetical protein